MAANILPCYYGKGSHPGYLPRGLVDHNHKKHGDILRADKKQCKKCRNFFISVKCPVNALAGESQGSGGGGHGPDKVEPANSKA